MDNEIENALKIAREALIYHIEQTRPIERTEKAINTIDRVLQRPSKVTRLEVIDSKGRSYTNWGVTKLDYQLQDDGRTLKIFTDGEES